jgi:hypothetical protein
MKTQSTKSFPAARTAHSICREWRQAHLKAEFEISMLDEDDDEGTARIADLADSTKHELENNLGEASITTGDDVAAVLGVALCILDAHDDGERAGHLIRLARKAAYRLGEATLRKVA